MINLSSHIMTIPPLIGMSLGIAVRVAIIYGFQFRIEENNGKKMTMDDSIEYNRVNFQVQNQVVIGYGFY